MEGVTYLRYPTNSDPQMITPCGETEIVSNEIFTIGPSAEKYIAPKIFGSGTVHIDLAEDNIEIENSVYDPTAELALTIAKVSAISLITGNVLGYGFRDDTISINYNTVALPNKENSVAILQEDNAVNIKVKGNMDLSLSGDVGLEYIKVRKNIYGNSDNKNNTANTIYLDYHLEDDDYAYDIKSNLGSTQVYDKNNKLIQDNAPRYIILNDLEEQMLNRLKP